MKLILRKLDFKRCFSYFKSEYSEGLFFSQKITKEAYLKEGDFFTIVPDNVKGENLYKFQLGGLIYPFYRPPEVTVMRVRNDSNIIVDSSLIEYVSKSNTHFSGLEDFSDDPNLDIVSNHGLKYCLLQNSKLFYWVDYKSTSEEFAKYKRKIRDYLSLCLLLKLPSRFFDSMPDNHSDDRITNQIFDGIISFFVEVYDGEGFLLWVSQKDHSFLKLIKNKIS